jgi:hypothetical protein
MTLCSQQQYVLLQQVVVAPVALASCMQVSTQIYTHINDQEILLGVFFGFLAIYSSVVMPHGAASNLPSASLLSTTEDSIALVDLLRGKELGGRFLFSQEMCLPRNPLQLINKSMACGGVG